MNKKSVTSGLDPVDIADILSIGAGVEHSNLEITTEEKTAELLQDRLAEPLILSSDYSGPFSDYTDLFSNKVLSQGKTVGDLLFCKSTQLSLIIKIKELNHKLSQSSECKIEKDTAVALYYAAIASALIYHNKKISGFDYLKLKKAYDLLLDKTWMSQKLCSLFNSAVEECQKNSAI